MESDLRPQELDYDDEDQQPIVDHTDESFFRDSLVAGKRPSRLKRVSSKILNQKIKS